MKTLSVLKAYNLRWLHFLFLLFWLFVIAALNTTAHAAEKELIMGIFPRYNAAENMTMYTPLANYLSERLGRKVKLVTAKDFESFWQGVSEQRYDIVHYNQYHYVNSADTYQVIALNKEFGKSAVAGAIFVRKDSGITAVSQLRGRKIVFGGGKDAMLSYIAPRYLLMQAGLREEDYKTEFSINPPNALITLHHKLADAAGGGEILIDLPLVKDAINTEELMLLAKTEPLSFLPWAVNRKMPKALREIIQSSLLDLENSEDGRKVMKAAKITGLGKAEDKDYDPVRKMVSAVFGSQGITR